jgi:hypothetical protein
MKFYQFENITSFRTVVLREFFIFPNKKIYEKERR